MKFQTQQEFLRKMNIYEHMKLEETLDQRGFKYNNSLKIVEHNMI